MENYKKRYLRVLQLFLSLAVTTIFFYFFWKKVNVADSISFIVKADKPLIIAAVSVSLTAAAVLASFQWKFLLEMFNCRIGFWESLFIKLSIAPLKGLIPFKAGEILRCGYLHRRHSIKMSKCLKAVMAYFILALIALLAFFIIGVLTGGPRILFGFTSKGVILGVISLMTLFLFGKFKPFRLFLSSHKAARIIRIITLALVIRFFEFSAFFLICRSLGVVIPFVSILFFLPMAILAANLPLTLFGMGTRETAVLLLFSGFASQEKLLSCSLLYSFAYFILPAIIGLACLAPFINALTRPGKEVIKERA